MRSIPARRRAPSGFTLVEIMICVAIIGILSSMAIPGYKTLVTQARETERTIHFTKLKWALIEQWRTGGFSLPVSTGCTTTNPFLSPETYKDVQFNTGITKGSANWNCWNSIRWGIDGGTRVRFTYQSTAPAAAGAQWSFDIYAYADMNDNGIPSLIHLHCIPSERQDCASGSQLFYSGDPTEFPTQTITF